MASKVETVLVGFTSLSELEQDECIRRLNRIIEAPERERKVLIEDLRKGTRLTLGPVADGCPCCGR